MSRPISADLIQFFKILGVVLSILIFVYSTFATTKYVDERLESVVGILKDIQTRVLNVESILMKKE